MFHCRFFICLLLGKILLCISLNRRFTPALLLWRALRGKRQWESCNLAVRLMQNLSFVIRPLRKILKRQRSGAGSLRGAQLRRLVSPHHARDAGACLLGGICAAERLHCSATPLSLQHRSAVLALTVPEVRHLLGQLIWPAPSSDPGAGLVLVAALPPKSCQLLPYQTSSARLADPPFLHSLLLGGVHYVSCS